MGKIFFKIFSFLFLFYVVNPYGQKQQRNAIKFKRQAAASIQSDISIWPKQCENISSCGKVISEALANETVLTYQKIVLDICYPSTFATADWAKYNHIQVQGKFKLSRRFKLTKKKISSACKKDSGQKGSAIWMDFRLSKTPSQTIFKMESSMIDGIIDIADVELNGKSLFRYSLQDFVKILFQGNNSCNTDMNKFSNEIIANNFFKSAGDGAFLNEFVSLGVIAVIAMDLSASIVYLLNKTEQDFAIFYTIGVVNRTTTAEKNELTEECKKRLAEWNAIAGFKKYVYNEKMCLITNEEFIRAKMGVILSEHDEKALNESQEYGGSVDGPLFIAPLESLEEEKKKATSVTVVENPDDYDFDENANLRIKKQAVGEKVPPKKKCSLYQTAIADLWKYCDNIINNIAEQDICDCAYAVVPASVLTDRACIVVVKKRKLDSSASEKADINRKVSARDAMECTTDGVKGKGCTRSEPYKVWRYYTADGTVNEICKPFVNNGARPDWEQRCFASCDRGADVRGSLDLLRWIGGFHKNTYHRETEYKTWRNVKIFAGTLYKVIFNRNLFGKQKDIEQTMINEITTNGSIVAVMRVYNDFSQHNPDGIYRHRQTATLLGLHAVRLIGYGHVECEIFYQSEGGKTTKSVQKYWLAANSWGTEAHKKGIFRILRGVDECGIESLSVSWGDVHMPFDGGK